MARTRRISPADFGTLYHGTDTPGLSVLHQAQGGGPRYAAMRDSHGYNFATTELQTAIGYARAGSGTPVVYEVDPQRKSDPWGPDPNSGPNGFHDGPSTKSEALDIAQGGGEASLRFRSPLRVKREVWLEDKAKDVTNGGFDDRPSYGGGNLSDYHTMGRSFS